MSFDLKTKIIFPVIMVIISLTIILIISEVSLRILNIGYGNAPLESHPVFHHVHPANYKFISHVPSGEYGGFQIQYNADRLVSNPDGDFSKKEHSNCRVAFLGDSFTEAIQVPYRDSFVGILDSHSDCIMRNYGVSSYSPIFYLLQWRKIVRKFHPSLVVVQIYSNDISSDAEYMTIAIKDKNKRVTAIPGPKSDWMTILLRKSYFFRFLRKVQLQLMWIYNHQGKTHNIVAGMVEENPDISKLSSGLIRTLAQEVKASGAQFIFTVIPSKFRLFKKQSTPQPLQFSDKWKLFAQQNGIPFMDLTKPFEQATEQGVQLFFTRDIHFNKNGHKLAASTLSKLYPQLFNLSQSTRSP